MILAIIQAVWSASKSVSEEIDGKTALTVLSKPVSRRSFVFGKFVGISWTVAVMFIVLGAFFVIIVAYKPVYDARESSKLAPIWEDSYLEVIRTIPGLLLAYMETVVLGGYQCGDFHEVTATGKLCHMLRRLRFGASHSATRSVRCGQFTTSSVYGALHIRGVTHARSIQHSGRGGGQQTSSVDVSGHRFLILLFVQLVGDAACALLVRRPRPRLVLCPALDLVCERIGRMALVTVLPLEPGLAPERLTLKLNLGEALVCGRNTDQSNYLDVLECDGQLRSLEAASP